MGSHIQEFRYIGDFLLFPYLSTGSDALLPQFRQNRQIQRQLCEDTVISMTKGRQRRAAAIVMASYQRKDTRDEYEKRPKEIKLIEINSDLTAQPMSAIISR